MATSTFGELLREYRLRAGLSQSDLAERARLSVDAVGTIERGVRKAPYRTTVTLLAKALALNSEETSALEDARVARGSKARPSGVAHNLQVERTSFVGRETDVATIINLLRRSRLTTVTGAGGVGKTRAAVEAAWRLLGCDPWDDVWFIDFAPLVDGNSIPARIASTIRPPLTNRAESIVSLVSAFAKRRMLLIFDNCEHLVTQAACAADEILEGCPHVSILATSREPLGVGGEFVYRLPSLAPEDAADLFVQRAEAADQRASLDAAQMPAIVEIARRLDGIPLAIELIAAQMPVLGLDTLLTRLHDEFRILSGPRNRPSRQQTVATTIQWSFDLLTADEQGLLSEVAMFSGGFSLAGAEAVSGRNFVASRQLRLLLSLVNKSLINVDNADGRTRYWLSESVRSFALARLREAGTYDEVARRHLRWLADIAEEVEATT